MSDVASEAVGTGAPTGSKAPSVHSWYVQCTEGAARFESVRIEQPTGGRVHLELGYRRSPEIQGAEPGQDAVTVIASAEYAAIVVCDGMTTSYSGDLAARHLALKLGDELWQARRAPPPAAVIEAFLELQRRQLAEEIARHEPPPEVRGLLRELLQDLKSLRGSATVFSAAIVDLESRCATIYRAGNVAVRYAQHRDPSMQVLISSDRTRWSDRGGLSAPIASCSVQGVQRLTLHTDGWVPPSGREERPMDASMFERQSAASQTLTDGDDCALVDLTLLSAEPTPGVR